VLRLEWRCVGRNSSIAWCCAWSKVDALPCLLIITILFNYLGDKNILSLFSVIIITSSLKGSKTSFLGWAVIRPSLSVLFLAPTHVKLYYFFFFFVLSVFFRLIPACLVGNNQKDCNSSPS